MNNKLAAALTGAALVAALTGCGASHEEALNAWAKQVCDKVPPQEKKIQEADKLFSETTPDDSPEKVKEVDSKVFGQKAEAYRAIAVALDKAGKPPAEDAEKAGKLYAESVKGMKATAAAYRDLKTQVDKLDTKDQRKFADGLQELAAEPNRASKAGHDAFLQLQSGEIGTAMAEQPGCKKTSPSAGS
ncbi:hypothetical protein GCM10010406_20420 [Streptomyces thermolineatus]|uniref:Small secreted protein n=1 Tax=Streptomyces thermolineatus TaxID=44033 RepID=A0ABN3LGV1_9ACTN